MRENGRFKPRPIIAGMVRILMLDNNGIPGDIGHSACCSYPVEEPPSSQVKYVMADRTATRYVRTYARTHARAPVESRRSLSLLALQSRFGDNRG